MIKELRCLKNSILLVLFCLILLFTPFSWSDGSAHAQLLLEDLEDALQHEFGCPFPSGRGPCTCPNRGGGDQDYSPPDSQPVEPPPENQGTLTENAPPPVPDPEQHDQIDPPTPSIPDPDQDLQIYPPPGSSLDSDQQVEFYPPSNFTPDYYLPAGSPKLISDDALPLAVGASAAIVALGALGVAMASGTPPQVALDQLKELIGIDNAPPRDVFDEFAHWKNTCRK